MRMRAWIVLAVVALMLSAAGLAAAVVELPPPTGPYGVGRTLTYLKDDDRAETWTEDSKDRRELPLFIWYPADAGITAPLAEYLPYPPDKIRGRLAGERARGRGITIHTRTDVPVAKGTEKFPVVLFSGGAGASPSSYHTLIEDLVSHGYVVVGMDHPYEGAGQVLGDGRVLEPTAETFAPTGDPNTEAFAKAMRAFYFRRVVERSADAKMAVGMLKMMAKSGRFAGRLDLDRVGIFGHSLGGVAAAHALADIVELKAGVNLDGHAASMPFDAEHTPTKPFMCIEAPSFPPTDEKLAKWNLTREAYETMERDTDERQAAVYRTNPTVSYRVTINGAEHASFSDEPTLKAETPNYAGSTRAQIVAAARKYLFEFFEKSLRGKSSKAMTAVPAEFEAFVRLESFGRETSKAK